MDFPLFSISHSESPAKHKKRCVDSLILQDAVERMHKDDPTKTFEEEKEVVSVKNLVPYLEPPPDLLHQDVPLKFYLGNIRKNVKKCHLEALFLEEVTSSDLKEINLVMDKTTGVHKGFGFIELFDEKSASKILSLNGCDLFGSDLVIRPAQENNIKVQGKNAHRRFGSLDYSSIAAQVDKRHKQLVANQIETNEKARVAFLAKKAKKEEAQKEFVADGGKLPEGYGHGLAKGKPKLHSGYSNFDM